MMHKYSMVPYCVVPQLEPTSELRQMLGDEKYFQSLEAKRNEWETMDR